MIILILATIINVNFQPRIIFSDGYIKIAEKKCVPFPSPGDPSIPVYPLEIKADGRIDNIHWAIKDIKSVKKSVKGAILPNQVPSILSLPPRKWISLKKFDVYPKQIVQYKGVSYKGNESIISFIIFPARVKNDTIQLIEGVTISIKYDTKKILHKISDSLDLAIITNREFKNAFEELRNWKMKEGIKTGIFEVDSIVSSCAGRDTQEKIRNFVKSLYYNRGLKYLILGGDEDVIPSRVAFAMSSEAGIMPDEDSLHADLYYGDLDGDWDRDQDGIFGEVEDSVDLYPEVSVGRVPARKDHIEDVNAFIGKLINYEKNPGSNLQKDLFLGMILWEDPYTDGGKAKDRIIDRCIPPYINVMRMYESIGNSDHDSVIQGMNTGPNLINHNGHGWYTGMWIRSGQYVSIGDMDTLSNDTYGIVYSLGCWVGAFDYDAVSEHYIRNPSGGGVAFIGNSRYGWGSPGNPGFGYSDIIDEKFFNILYNKVDDTIGKILGDTKVSFIPLSRDRNVYRWHQYQINLLGDPSMRVWKKNPDTMRVVFLDSNNCIVVHNNTPVENATVVEWGNNYKILKTDFTGGFPIYADSCNITITKEGFLPIEFTHNRKSGIKLNLITSNNKNILFPGKGMYFDLSIKNNTGKDIDSALAKVTGNSIDITDSLTAIENLNNGDSLYIDSAFYGIPGINLMDGDLVSIKLAVLGDTLIKYFGIGTPVMSLNNVDYRGDAILFTWKNVGHFSAAGVTRAIFSSPFPLNPNRNIGEILPGQNIQDTVFFQSPFIGDLETVLSTENGSTIDTTLRFMNYYSFYDNCEPPDTFFTHSGVRDYWHLSSRRSHQGSYSWYCGIESTYTDSQDASLISLPVIASNINKLSFYYYYSFPNYGSDGLYIILMDGDTNDTLDYIGSGGALKAIQGGWYKSEFDLPVQEGDTFSICFSWKSDNDSMVGEGIYIDDIIITGNKVSQAISIFPKDSLKISYNTENGTYDIYFLLEKYKNLSFNVYDIMGRNIYTKKINCNTGLNHIVAGIREFKKEGVYFIRIGGFPIEKIVFLRREVK